MISLQFLIITFVVVLTLGARVIYAQALGQGRRAARACLPVSARAMAWRNRSFAALLAVLAGRLVLEPA